MPIFNDKPLSDVDRKAIHDFALTARNLLTTEARDLLEGVYGLTMDGALAPLSRLPNLTNDPDGQETYKRVEKLLADEVKGGLTAREAVDKLVKEIAFTHLNRSVAFKMMEDRKLIRQAVGRGLDSNGFKFYMADHPEDETMWKGGPDGAEVAYQHFLLWQSGQIARELKVLFDPNTLPSHLFPRPAALRAILLVLNSEKLAHVWNYAETIGWVYQFFNEHEKTNVFDRLYNKKQKIRREDIPAATQLFTPRWIVRFLIENSLGRTWIELHPDSRLINELDYLVPSAEVMEGKRTKSPRLAREITLLDPACGTMHFGLVAFDLFVEMYREELERSGQPGWPSHPSVASEAEIPASIISNNLFGIDIDLRAVQLSALTLFLKAKELNKNTTINDSNLACADVLALNGERLNTFLKEMNFQKPSYERLIRALWARLGDINQLGSLIRLEAEIEDLVAEERKRFDKEGHQPDLFGERPLYEREAAQDEYWDIIAIQLIQAFDEFARRSAYIGKDENFFSGEAIKGMRLLNMMLGRYDCVTANPPYMSKRNMNSTLSNFMDDAYPEGKGDLYTAFISRCAEFVHPGGRLGMITQQSFMFVSSYEQLRKNILGHFAIETMAHTGSGAFAEIGGAKVNTTVFCMRAEPDIKARENAEGIYYRLVKADDKQAAFERALQYGTNTYRVHQSQFDIIPGGPWVYWISSSIRKVFKENPSLSEAAEPRAGMHGGDRFRFARYWWEIGIHNLKRGCKSREEAFNTGLLWFPYMKGGTYKKWYGNQEWVVTFNSDHYRILSEVGNRLPSRQYYFREGITYSAVTSSKFSARISPGGFLFDAGGSSLFPKNLLLTLACLNSNLINVALDLINPTVNIQAGDIARLPIPKNSSSYIEKLAWKAILYQKFQSTHDETTYDFIAPTPWEHGLRKTIEYNTTRIAELEEEIDDKVLTLYDLAPSDSATLESDLLDEGRNERETFDESPNSDEVSNDDSKEVMNSEKLAAFWVAYAVSAVFGRSHLGIEKAFGCAIYSSEDFQVGSLPKPNSEEFDDIVGPLDQFAYTDEKGGMHIFPAEVEGTLNDLKNDDGILVLDEGHLHDLPAKVEIALDLMLGEGGAAEVVFCLAHEDLLDPSQKIEFDSNSLREFLERDFFTKWHTKWYRKRPIYWLLQSPQKRYGLYIFHERLTKDTLFLIQRKYLDPKINLTRQLLEENRLNASRQTEARTRRQLDKQSDELEKLLTDLEEFARRLKAITDRGYDPDINDGVILNMAPLWEVIPSWSKEPQKYWEGLERGDYDWAHIAMKYWPDRVKEKCKTDKSLAIAHGLA